MVDPQPLVEDFHHFFEMPNRLGKLPNLRGVPETGLRMALIDEEYEELRAAVSLNDVIGAADALADLVYVLYGAALTWGIPLSSVLAEVHRSNMTKLGADLRPIRREDGKVLKGPNYQPPDIAAAMGYPPDA